MSVSQGNGVLLGGRTTATYERLRELIISGELAPDSELSQLELTRMLGVSRTPLREALRLLESDGLVSGTDPHRLVRISALSMSDLEGLYSLRVPAEAMAVWQTVPTLTVMDLATLRRTSELTMTGESAVAIQAHRQFHSILWKNTSKRVQDALRNMSYHAERYQRAFVVQSKTGRSQKQNEHRQIIRACELADRSGAVEAITEHLSSTAYGLMRHQNYTSATLPTAVHMALELCRAANDSPAA